MDVMFFATPDELRTWFARNAENATELLVGYYKKGAGRSGIKHTEAVEQALCFGWIDSVGQRIDDERYQVRFTPRRRAACGARSTWRRSPS